MASPIHNYLFSPPPSPPTLPVEVRVRSPALASLATFLLPSDGLGRPSRSSGEIKIRSPKTPTQRQFTLDTVVFPSAFCDIAEDTTPRAPPRAASRTRSRAPVSLATAYDSIPVNVPSTRTPLPNGLPRPLIRLIVLCSLLFSCIIFLAHVPAARLPTFGLLGSSPDWSNGQVALSRLEDGDGAYVPPQIYPMRVYSRFEDDGDSEWLPRQPVPHPKTTRPAARPLPRSLELLALQSYLLQSRYNILPIDIDPSIPLDANVVLGFDAHDIALDEIERERAEDVVVWYGGDGSSHQPHQLLNLLAETHGPNKRPTLLPLFDRPDIDRILPIVSRLDLDVGTHPVVFIGNRPFVADPDTLKAMQSSGQLQARLSAIGWNDEAYLKKKKWTPKMAKVDRKRTLSEVELAVKLAGKR